MFSTTFCIGMQQATNNFFFFFFKWWLISNECYVIMCGLIMKTLWSSGMTHVSSTRCTELQLRAHRSCVGPPWWRCRSQRWRWGQTGWSSGTLGESPAKRRGNSDEKLKLTHHIFSYIIQLHRLVDRKTDIVHTMCLFSALACLIQRSWVRGNSVEMVLDRESLLFVQVAPCSFRPRRDIIYGSH